MMPRSLARYQVAALLVLALGLAVVGGCARGGPDVPTTPQAVVDFWINFAGPINDAFYYFIPIDTDGDFGDDGPLPVAAGPYWENGWGTGSYTHFVEYHLGQFSVYKVNVEAALKTAGGGVIAATGNPTDVKVGTHTLTIGALTLGTVTVTGTGMITSAANNSLQSAGALTLQTDAAGRTLAGTVVFTPATDGGRTLTAAEQASVDALNAGGVLLQANSLAGLGLTLTLGPVGAGSQTLTIAPTTAAVQDEFEGADGRRTTAATTLRANSRTATATPPVPGAQITTGDLVPNGVASVTQDLSPIATVLGPPFAYTLPAGGSVLRFTVDVAQLGNDIPDLSLNVITTNELIFDPTITDPNQHSYDGLGALGNRYVTFRTNQYQTISNNSGLFEREMGGDTTLIGPTTQTQRNAIDITDWVITIRQLR